MKKVLVFGFGNVGRQDDGLGIKLVECLEELNIPSLSLDANFQLNAEDAMAISEFEVVIFVDASVNCKEPFEFSRLEPALEIGFTTHAMHPASVLALCKDLFDKNPETYLLTIPGYEWEFEAPLSLKAKENLESAREFVLSFINRDCSEI